MNEAGGVGENIECYLEDSIGIGLDDNLHEDEFYEYCNYGQHFMPYEHGSDIVTDEQMKYFQHEAVDGIPTEYNSDRVEVFNFGLFDNKIFLTHEFSCFKVVQ